MRAADVVASFNRWAPVSSLGLAISDFLDEIVEVDPVHRGDQADSPLVALPSLLARQPGPLDPSQVGDRCRGIGTDDRRALHRHRPLQVRRAPGRTASRCSTASTTMSGSKRRRAATPAARRPISTRSSSSRCRKRRPGSPACRRASTTIWRRSSPTRSRLSQDDPGVNIEILPPRSYGMIIMNTAAGLMTDQTLRQAVQAAIAVVPSGQATHGEGYFEPGPGIMLPQTVWASDVSAELYNQDDPEKARQLLAGGRLRRHADPAPLHPGGPRRLQRRRRRPAAARGGRVHRRAGGHRRGDARREHRGRRALGHDDQRDRLPA